MNRTEFLEHLSVICGVKPATIENFKDSPDILFNMACEWEGFIGFGESIKRSGLMEPLEAISAGLIILMKQ